jgi:hypothetical protein
LIASVQLPDFIRHISILFSAEKGNRGIAELKLGIDAVGALMPLLASRQVRILEDAAVVWQVRFALRLMTGAKSAIRNRDDRVEELRLLPRI